MKFSPPPEVVRGFVRPKFSSIFPYNCSLGTLSGSRWEVFRGLVRPKLSGDIFPREKVRYTDILLARKRAPFVDTPGWPHGPLGSPLPNDKSPVPARPPLYPPSWIGKKVTPFLSSPSHQPSIASPGESVSGSPSAPLPHREPVPLASHPARANRRPCGGLGASPPPSHRNPGAECLESIICRKLYPESGSRVRTQEKNCSDIRKPNSTPDINYKKCRNRKEKVPPQH